MDSIGIDLHKRESRQCQRRLKMGHRHRVKMGQVAGTEP